jgi:hypothetical protein
MLQELVNRKLDELGDRAAETFGVSPAMIENWRKGTTPIPLRTLESIIGEQDSADPTELPILPDAYGVKWEGKEVIISLPWYKSTHPVTAFSIMGLLERGKMSVMMSFGDAFVAHARNNLARRFLKTGVEWMLTVDDDMICPVGNAKWFNSLSGLNLPDKFAGMNTVERLRSHGKTLVGALYSGRSEQGAPMYAEGVANATEQHFVRQPRDQIKPTKWVATGCLLINRKVFEDISKKFPHLEGHWFSSSEHDLVTRTKEAVAVLGDETVAPATRIAKAKGLISVGNVQSNRNSHTGVGEDVQFCARALEAGHQPYVDLGLVCGHVGYKTYSPTTNKPKGN